MFKLFKQFWKSEDLIFYRAPKNDKERLGSHSQGLINMPDKDGYTKVYMPYGPQGKGFYYSKL